MTTNEQSSHRTITNHYGREETGAPATTSSTTTQQTPNLQQLSPSSSLPSPQVTIEQVYQSQQQQYAMAAAAAWSSSVFMSDLYQRNLFERYILPAATAAAASVVGGLGLTQVTGNGLTNVSSNRCTKIHRPIGESNFDIAKSASPSEGKSYGEKSLIRRRRPRRGKRKRRCRKRKRAVDGVHETSNRSATPDASRSLASASGIICINKRSGHSLSGRQQTEHNRACVEVLSTRADLRNDTGQSTTHD
jgi:hypothetical protein